MKLEEKHYMECSLDLLIEVPESDRERIMKKINGIISSALKGEKVVHVSKNINLISEADIILSMTSGSLKDIN
tara:strand:- start:271 stop:489 length:219 start_codon:yes stop_codon:yes gene_type:complete